MLREIAATRQDDTGTRKRWFTDSDMDLYIWLKDDTPVRFQLTYNKQDKEHAINWDSNNGFSHNCVDSGEENTGQKYKMSPILLPDGEFDATSTAAEFLLASENIDKTIASFTYERLIEYQPQYNKIPDGKSAPDN